MDHLEDEEDGEVLQQDLHLSDEEDDDDEDLLLSRMHANGQLNNDLALSDSDDEETLNAIRRGDANDTLDF